MKMTCGVPMPCRIEPVVPARRSGLPFEPMAPYPVRAPRPLRQGPSVSGLAVAAAAALSGCASGAGDAPGWRVEPVYRVPASTGPAVSQGYAALARQYEGESRWDQASEAWRKAAVAEPDNAELHTSLGVALAQSQRVLQAIEAFRAAAALRPDSARALNNLGFAYSLEGRDDEAQRALHRALAADPRHAQARANLAAVERRLGLRGADELTDGAAPQAVAAMARRADTVAASAPVDIPLPLAPVTVQQAPNLAAMAMDSSTDPSQRLERVVAGHPMAMQMGGPVTEPPVAARAAEAPAGTWRTQARPLADLPAAAAQGVPAARVAIVNAVGVRGAAAQVRELLKPHGVDKARLYNQSRYREPVTVVQYRNGFDELARRIASALPKGARFVESGALGAGTDVRVTLGRDRKAVLSACVARKSCASMPTVLAKAGR